VPRSEAEITAFAAELEMVCGYLQLKDEMSRRGD
jgi:hypothetical protein